MPGYFYARTKTLYNSGNRVFGRVLIIKDVTAKKLRDKKIQEIEQKELLMRELNHRVKNNLALVSSLISIRNSELGENVDLSDLQHQVNVIRMLYEKLVQSGKVSNICIREYIQDILLSVLTLCNFPLQINNDLPKLEISTQEALLLGLIVNEMATPINPIDSEIRPP